MPSPFFSIVTPVYQPPTDVLRSMIESVRAQTFQDWELILVDDASPDPQVLATLRGAAASDPRITVVARPENGHIVAASNDGVRAASGEFIVLVDHDDLITPRALQLMHAAIQAEPEADYLYSDEDKIDVNGRRYDTFRKPDWSPERLRGQMYTSHLSVYRTELVRDVGGFRDGYDGSQDHDLALRVSERARRVVHVPEVLYHWRVVQGSAAGDSEAKPYAWLAGQRAVQDQLDRLGIEGTVHRGQVPGTYVVQRRLDPSVRVSVIIPTRGSGGLVWGRRRVFVVEAVRSLLARGGHDNLEIVVVHDTATPLTVLEELEALGAADLRLVPYDQPFNFSEKCNLGVTASYGDVVVLLNDDIEIESDDFLAQLCGPLAESDVGMTGTRLLFADTTVQHAGLVLDRRDMVHAFAGRRNDDPGPFAALLVNRETSGLTAACVALRRETFERVGGFSERLPANFNDVDLSLKIGNEGLRQVWVANAVAFHFESQTRVPVVHDWERDLVLQRWHLPEQDRYLPFLKPVPSRTRRRSTMLVTSADPARRRRRWRSR
ncbi:glycosyltransferase family 2 protein [Nocardioides flavescens]|uniref:Glycosyltransferase n=1 Tax=Nocardioides flavescens TaxID=2691959 RepID=A0A6L7ESY4_9ACTN|nr:glycosyltransferase [Nocardioides flavescens]MXG89800.1 glycosyltransferase [Nocardioides flavescens]